MSPKLAALAATLAITEPATAKGPKGDLGRSEACRRSLPAVQPRPRRPRADQGPRADLHLVLVSDNNFAASQFTQFLLFALKQ
jgi:hypothetical protein